MFNENDCADMTFVFDLDGTICPIKSAGESYADLRPFPEIVERMRQLHERGAKIAISTSRNMRSYEGNLGVINLNTAAVLLPWLEKWHIPCDELYYAKPWPGHKGVYVDDRAVRPDEFLSRTMDELEDMCRASRCDVRERDMAMVITMAGFGTRFRDAGYDVPKYEIESCGKTLFEWSMESLADYLPHASRLVFAVRKSDDSGDFILEKCEALGFDRDRVRLLLLDEPTDGQATTCYLATELCEEFESLMVYNIDTYVEQGGLLHADLLGDGCVPCFSAPGDHWSFVRLGKDGNAVEVREKERVSENCSIGAYWFRSVGLYRDAYESYYSSEANLVRGEKYIAPLYNWLIDRGYRVTMEDVLADKVHVLGTPEELRTFEDAMGRRRFGGSR